MVGIADLIRNADQALASREFSKAAMLLEEAAALDPGDLSLWMRVAAMHRAAGQYRKSLDAVREALAINARDFMALLMRASLLQQLGDAKAGEAWGQALAQRPENELPGQLGPIIADAEKHYAEWQDKEEHRLRERMAAIEARADLDERTRMARFRTNALRRTKTFHSNPTDYFYPGLREREFHPRPLFPWIERLEQASEVIAGELREVMAAERAELVPYVQFDDHEPMDQWRELNRNSDWTAIHLFLRGERIDSNARHCPQTMALLSELPQPKIAGAAPNAMFSLLAPHTLIPPHVGISNARLVCHLPLIVPDGCWFRVGAETRFWKPGEAFVFDDTIEHEASNPTDELRVVFIFDVWHPDLSTVEQDAVEAVIAGRQTSETSL